MKYKRSFNLFEKENVSILNNPLKTNIPRTKLFKYLFPLPHGVSDNLIKEYLSMRKKNWIRLFKNNNLEIVEIIDGLCFSGYGFGFDRIRNMLLKMGIACEYIFILQKAND